MFNVQSLHAHKLDIEDDEVIKESYILALTETHIDKMDSNYLKGYKNISNYMRNNIKFGGVAFFKKNNININLNYCNLHLENDNNLESKKIDMTSVKLIKNNLVIIIFLLYVSPNTSIS